MEFPKFSTLKNTDNKEIMQKNQPLIRKNKDLQDFKCGSINFANDPTEIMFRNMMQRISGVNKDIKSLTCQNLKQTTFIDPNTLSKRKVVPDDKKKKKIEDMSERNHIILITRFAVIYINNLFKSRLSC